MLSQLQSLFLHSVEVDLKCPAKRLERHALMPRATQLNDPHHVTASPADITLTTKGRHAYTIVRITDTIATMV